MIKKVESKRKTGPSGLCPAAHCSRKANFVIGTTSISVFEVRLCCQFVKMLLEEKYLRETGE